MVKYVTMRFNTCLVDMINGEVAGWVPNGIELGALEKGTPLKALITREKA